MIIFVMLVMFTHTILHMLQNATSIKQSSGLILEKQRCRLWQLTIGKNYHMTLKALANEDTLLPTQMFLRLPAHAQHLLQTQKIFLILFRNILWPQQMFPGLRNMETMLPRFQCFWGFTCYLKHAQKFLLVRQNG